MLCDYGADVSLAAILTQVTSIQSCVGAKLYDTKTFITSVRGLELNRDDSWRLSPEDVRYGL